MITGRTGWQLADGLQWGTTYIPPFRKRRERMGTGSGSSGSVYGGAGYDYECAGVEEGVGGSGEHVVTLDMVHTLEAAPNLKVESGAGSPVVYVNFQCHISNC